MLRRTANIDPEKEDRASKIDWHCYPQIPPSSVFLGLTEYAYFWTKNAHYSWISKNLLKRQVPNTSKSSVHFFIIVDTACISWKIDSRSNFWTFRHMQWFGKAMSNKVLSEEYRHTFLYISDSFLELELYKLVLPSYIFWKYLFSSKWTPMSISTPKLM